MDARKQLSAKMAAAAATSATSRVSFSTAAGAAMAVDAMMAVRKTRNLVCILMVGSGCLKMRVFLKVCLLLLTRRDDVSVLMNDVTGRDRFI